MLKAEKRAAGSAMEEIAHTWTQDNMATGRQTLSHYGSEMGKASKSSTDAAAKPDDILRFTSISNFEPKDS